MQHDRGAVMLGPDGKAQLQQSYEGIGIGPTEIAPDAHGSGLLVADHDLTGVVAIELGHGVAQRGVVKAQKATAPVRILLGGLHGFGVHDHPAVADHRNASGGQVGGGTWLSVGTIAGFEPHKTPGYHDPKAPAVPAYVEAGSHRNHPTIACRHHKRPSGILGNLEKGLALLQRNAPLMAGKRHLDATVAAQCHL